jgi:hypothetical protein
MGYSGVWKMKIKSIEVVLTWEDGTVNEVSNYLPEFTSRALEEFADYWEEKYSDEDETKDEEVTEDESI